MQDWAREMFGGVASSSASPFIAQLFTLWASPLCCDGPAYSFTIRISLGHTRDKPRDDPRISLCYDSTWRWGLTKLLPAVPVPASAFTLCSHRSISDTGRGNPDVRWDRSPRQAPKPNLAAPTKPGPTHCQAEQSPKYNRLLAVIATRSWSPFAEVWGSSFGWHGGKERRAGILLILLICKAKLFFFFAQKCI